MSGQSLAFVLLTDFGGSDPYAGQLKATLLTAAAGLLRLLPGGPCRIVRRNES